MSVGEQRFAAEYRDGLPDRGKGMMEAYTDFAQVYDELMDATPYGEWCEFLVGVFRRYGVDDISKNNRCVANRNGVKSDDNVISGDAAISKKGIITEKKAAADGGLTEGYRDTVSLVSEQTAKNLCQERNTILDLGCGTGTLTELLARRGYDMIGLDNAPEMLQIAMEKRERSGLPILYLMQDMRELELYGTVGAVVSVCDSLNYLLREEDIVETFRRVNTYLYPRGIFVFDFNTVYKYAQVIGDATIAENREDCSFIWENYYHEAEEINEYDLTVFVASQRGAAGVEEARRSGESDAEEREQGRKAGAEDDGQGELLWFRRFCEVHYQRGYRLEQMKDFLAQAGLSFLEAMDADTHGEVTEESGRIYVVARKGEMEVSVKNQLDSQFFTGLFVPEHHK